MCGIAGVISSALDVSRREETVGRMIARQRHRGPDRQALASSGDATLGSARLAIIDPAAGHQPMQSSDGRFTLVFNGAIYNYRELRPGLAERGWQFCTQSDTEVLLAVLALDGPAGLPRLRGMFAFALWDRDRRALLAARDGFGIKPLYYAQLPGGGIAFASELNALVAGGLVAPEIDPDSAAEYLAWLAVPAPRTIYRGAGNLPPGHLLEVQAGRVRPAAWWHLPAPTDQERRAPNYSAFVHGLRARLEDSVQAHRVADAPLGVFLSGGLDSSAITALLARQGGRVKSVALVFDDPALSEADSARFAARTFGTEHHEECLTGRRVAEDMPRLLAAYDQPTGDGLNMFYASEAARTAGLKVALTGLGGDELFGSYPSFRDLPRLQRLLPVWRRLPDRLRQTWLARLHQAHSTRARKLADFLASARDLHELASLQRRVFSETKRLRLLAPEVRRQAARLGPLHPRLDEFVSELLGADEFQVISAWELRTYMADVLLRDGDVFSMAHSLEVRVPFLDPSLLGWLWPQPAWFKHDARHEKRALADAVADLVPPAIRRRAKMGFTLPLDRWMRAELRPFIEETFGARSLSACPWLEAAAVRELWEEFLSGRDRRAWSRVWSLAVLVAFANRPPRAAA